MSLQFDQAKPMDVVAMGRATIDIYANETGPLEEAVTFTKYVGGSPANTAVAMSNMGLKVGYIGKVSDDQFGRYIRQYLEKKGIDTSHIAIDKSGARSGITIGEIKSPTECNCLVYRQNVADLNISCSEIDEEYISKFKAVLISGTSLSYSPAREAVFLVMEFARRNGVRIVFDPDYREGTWNSDAEAAIYYMLAAEKADMVVATRDEYDKMESLLMQGKSDDKLTVKNLLSRNVKLVSIKHGKMGSTIYTADGKVYAGKPYPAKVVKTFGAGDAYAGTFMFGLISGKTIDESLKYASAASAITIGGHSCSDSTPTKCEVEAFITAYDRVKND
ncbi:5-dehydro-2-deoxygluconokinase [Sporomusa acidovorans]|uniref:5-dehydro-2-deoxygluconokinase n=1 Tax=Sporomusa acidovorans (strain ATCC 49682 / DSM 3132 / Mol) TaxID=1123286 RepID=A0ABZ3J9D8_SPOA4|nr:5-dehydro-2-deoxygluconokinase [Sporomusa acidovorans]OZC16150.1 5-dehydro-2-deoxygluconokinase [Sporomusa acidovorans DSM 3132]SDE29152.1 5-dehydro-2-deoxygluconokinase [Sporomusa acidovorans]